MKLTKAVAVVGFISMTAVILNGFLTGSFSQDGAELLANPWGIVSLVDLYVGFIIFSLWIAFREKNPVTAGLWIILMMVLGFFTASLYLLVVIRKSRGDWLTFFLGARKEKLLADAG